MNHGVENASDKLVRSAEVSHADCGDEAAGYHSEKSADVHD
jgi:hypothetical protein